MRGGRRRDDEDRKQSSGVLRMLLQVKYSTFKKVSNNKYAGIFLSPSLELLHPIPDQYMQHAIP
jgi:hypothetical protein